VSGGLIFVVNTPADTVDVIDATTQSLHARVHVGVDPVGIGVRPDGSEALNMTLAGVIAHKSALKDGEWLKIPQYPN
jgi:YVTN family beta-propeller protein